MLALLGQVSADGYTLKRRYDEYFGFGHRLAFAQVHAALSSFDRNDAKVIGIDSDGGPSRKRYRITPEGSTLVEDWIFSPEPDGLDRAREDPRSRGVDRAAGPDVRPPTEGPLASCR